MAETEQVSKNPTPVSMQYSLTHKFPVSSSSLISILTALV